MDLVTEMLLIMYFIFHLVRRVLLCAIENEKTMYVYSSVR